MAGHFRGDKRCSAGAQQPPQGLRSCPACFVWNDEGNRRALSRASDRRRSVESNGRALAALRRKNSRPPRAEFARGRGERGRVRFSGKSFGDLSQ